jgi:hypothetical protein
VHSLFPLADKNASWNGGPSKQPFVMETEAVWQAAWVQGQHLCPFCYKPRVIMDLSRWAPSPLRPPEGSMAYLWHMVARSENKSPSFPHFPLRGPVHGDL